MRPLRADLVIEVVGLAQILPLNLETVAHDALTCLKRGEMLTHIMFTIDGTTLVQHVEHEGAAYPVVADPYITFGWYVYVHLSPHDQHALITGGALGAAAIGGLVCAELGPGDAICAVGAAVVGGGLASYISDDYHPHCYLVVKYHYWGTIAGRSVDRCS